MQPPAGSQVSRVPAQRTPPEHSAPPAPLPVPQRPTRRLRTVLTVVAGVLALLCVGGGITGYVLYERAATPDRSAPDVVVDNYLREFLVNENDTRAELLVCDESSDDLAALSSLRDDLRDRARRFSATLTISWGALSVERDGEIAQVETDLILSAAVDGISQSDRQRWQFQTRLDEHWKVCRAKKVG
ncbi:hypothetical protein TPA0907_58760 [Micromonospora humidisoli]|uniref:hypothetical protein n=1 Tax=Micromonospora sp. AKA109 TaxID=2733865 RepID=UPI0022C92533|nr:hypothetical protein [Micromonospora sp. AKA109]GHJ11509.1 hypothetical protein TPA0907_58760 [Micromonospora sp. AKA109]